MQAKKPDFKIFAGGAEDGELHDFPDVTRGWGVTKLQTNKKPPLSWMNGAFNRVDNNFYYLLQNGLVEWNSEIEYSANALTQLNGVIYRAKATSKGESPAIGAKWERLFADKVGTSDFIGMSQSAIKKELDKKINSSDLTQTVTADKLKAPSNLAVNTALKEQDPRQWGFGSSTDNHWASDLTGADVDKEILDNLRSKSIGSSCWRSKHPSSYNGAYAAQLVIKTGDTWFNISADYMSGVLKVASGNRNTNYNITTVYSTANTSIDPNGVLTTKQDTVTLTTNDLAKKTGNSHSKVMTQKAVTDALGALGQPSMTGSATLNGATDNTVVLAGVVTTLGLEVGDVIRIQYSGYDKLHSVESITNNDLIIVNYEHAGNRGNGPLKLADETATVTITRISKWYNAPIGLGQSWVDVSASRALTNTYTNTDGRPIQILVSTSLESADTGFVMTATIQGVNVSARCGGSGAAGAYKGATMSFIVPAGGAYRVITASQGAILSWAELR